jgi:predicted RNase H-like nuclease (RuvC/YqgF family)
VKACRIHGTLGGCGICEMGEKIRKLEAALAEKSETIRRLTQRMADLQTQRDQARRWGKAWKKALKLFLVNLEVREDAHNIECDILKLERDEARAGWGRSNDLVDLADGKIMVLEAERDRLKAVADLMFSKPTVWEHWPKLKLVLRQAGLLPTEPGAERSDHSLDGDST